MSHHLSRLLKSLGTVTSKKEIEQSLLNVFPSTWTFLSSAKINFLLVVSINTYSFFLVASMIGAIKAAIVCSIRNRLIIPDMIHDIWKLCKLFSILFVNAYFYITPEPSFRQTYFSAQIMLAFSLTLMEIWIYWNV